MVRQTNKNTTVGPAADIRPGSMFKDGQRWYLATGVAVPARPTDTFDWKVQAYDRHGVASWVFIYGHEVEHARSGWRPGAFTPATIRRAAKLKEDQAHSMLGIVGRMRGLANALERQA